MNRTSRTAGIAAAIVVTMALAGCSTKAEDASGGKGLHTAPHRSGRAGRMCDRMREKPGRARAGRLRSPAGAGAGPR